jgi:hypothetical protein
MCHDRAFMSVRKRTISAAFEEAIRLGSGYAGPEHFLLALLRPGEETVAAQALRDCGADYERLRSALVRAAAERRVEPNAGVSLNPAAQELVGRAEGLAAGLGAESVTAEHVLLALVWDAQRGWPLVAAGTTREAVYVRLRAGGVRLAVELPTSREWPPGPEQRVYFPEEQLRDVLTKLPALLPPDADWGWNVDGAYRAWVRTTGEVDLRALVRQALARASA